MYGPETSPSASLQFADGVYLVLLMGLLEDYFVPLYNFHLTPDSFDQKVRVCSPSSEWPGNVPVTRASLAPAASRVPCSAGARGPTGWLGHRCPPAPRS